MKGLLRDACPPAGIDTAAWYRRYGPLVLRQCRRLLRDEEWARDAMHDTFLRVLRYQDRLEDRCPWRLLRRIATNVCLNHLRSTRRHPEVLEDSLDDRRAEGADPETLASVSATLASLFVGEVESTVLIAVLRYRDGMSVNEVARQLGLSASDVCRRLQRLRARHVDQPAGAEPIGSAA